MLCLLPRCHWKVGGKLESQIISEPESSHSLQLLSNENDHYLSINKNHKKENTITLVNEKRSTLCTTNHMVDELCTT